MSYQAIDWVLRHSRTTLGSRLILLTIAHHMNSDGTCHPSLGLLASETKISKRQIQRLLPRLERRGELVVSRTRGRGKPNSYQLPKLEEKVTHDVTFLERKGDILNPKKVTFSTIKGDIFDPLIRKEHIELKDEQYTLTPPTPSFPDWIPVDAWNGFVEMRKRTKHPLTERATRIAIRELTKLRDQGQDPAEVLDQSTFQDWRGLFPVRSNGNGQTHFYESRETIRNRRNAEAIARVLGTTPDAIHNSGNVRQGLGPGTGDAMEKVPRSLPAKSA
jgi:hypothetical protein